MGVKLREKLMKDGSSSLYLDIYFEGKRKYDFLNIHLSNKRKFRNEDKEKREHADKLRIKKENELFEQETVSFEKKNKEYNFYKYYENYLKQEKKKQPYWIIILNHLKQHANNSENLRFNTITDEWLLEFQNYLLTKIGNNSALLYMGCLNESFKSALRKKLITHNPFDSIPKSKRLKKDTNIERVFLTIKEIEKLNRTDYPAMPTEYKQIFLFCCFTGLRWSDAYGLQWDNITTIKKGKNTELVLNYQQEKTDKIEYMPLSKQAIKIINKLRGNNSKNIFSQIMKESEQRGHQNILSITRYHLKKWAARAEINKDLNFHTSRHTFATMSLTYGVDLYTVSKLLGHSDITTTTVYAKVVDEKKVTAVANLPKLNFNKTKS